MSEDLNGEVKKLEEELGLPKGFYDGLLKEDDWSFVVKLHALVEAAVTHLVVKRLGEDALSDVFAELELSDQRKGKLAFLGALDVFETEERRFVRTLSALRNRLVHGVRNVSFRFMDYVTQLDKQQRENFIEAFTFTHADIQVVNGVKVRKQDLVLTNPKVVIWQAGFGFLGYTSLLAQTAKSMKRVQEAAMELAEVVTKRSPIPPSEIGEAGGEQKV